MAVTASDEEVESQWGRLILADDVTAAFGREAKRTEILEIADEAIGQFALEGTQRAWVMVVLKDHQTSRPRTIDLPECRKFSWASLSAAVAGATALHRRRSCTRAGALRSRMPLPRRAVRHGLRGR